MASSTAHAALLGATFAAPSGTVISFKDVDGQLGLSVAGNEPVALRQQGHALRLEFEDAAVGPFDISFEAAAGPQATPDCLLLSECGNAERAERVVASAPDTQALAAELAGTYRCADLQATAELALDPGPQLQLRVRGEGGSNTLNLAALNADLFLCRPTDPLQPLRATLAVQRLGTAVRLVLNTTRTRGLVFERI